LLHKGLLIKQWGWCVVWVQNDEIVCLWVFRTNGVYPLLQQGAPRQWRTRYWKQLLLLQSMKTSQIITQRSMTRSEII